jgi:DDE superfamily endonuclease
VSSILQVLGKSQEATYAKHYHVLNRAQWSIKELSERLLRLVVGAFGGDPVVVGRDERIERRWGKKIEAIGIYRDAVRSSPVPGHNRNQFYHGTWSSESHLAKASGLRWISLMVLSWILWAQRIWALPVLTVLAPSERYHEERGKRHKAVTDWARQIIMQVRRWLPGHILVVVADGAYAVLDLLPILAMESHARFCASKRLHACQSLPNR